MARETKVVRALRTEQDNQAAALISTGTAAEDSLFGTLTLGDNLGPSADSQGWDIYEVNHSGFRHYWSSAVVRGSFACHRRPWGGPGE